jgi:antiviral helicase SLH1
MAYVAQNAGRIVRALLEIAISRKWANVSAAFMGMSKAIEKQLWPFDQPLKQFKLKPEVFIGLARFADDYSPVDFTELSAAEIGKLIHLNDIHGAAVLHAAQKFPSVAIEYKLRPISSGVLRIVVRVLRSFKWDKDLHGMAEPFWLWAEDAAGESIYQLAHLVFRQTTEYLDLDFVISIPNGKPPTYVTIRYVSDRWSGVEDEVQVPLATLKMPRVSENHTPRLDVPFLSLSAIQHYKLEEILSRQLHGFNAIQTQVLWSLLRTRMHSLVCAPTGSGKSVMGQLLTWYVFRNPHLHTG